MANLIFIATWYFANDGLYFWDDFTYLDFAHRLNSGTFAIDTNHFTSRIALIYPTSWVIRYLGINEFTIVVYPLLCGLIVLNLFFWIGLKTDRWVGVIGGLLLVSDYHLITFATHLFPELPLTLLTFIMLVAYHAVLRHEAVQRLAGMVGALAFFGAFLTKVTALLLLPLLFYWFINDRLKKRHRSFWLVFLSLSAFFFALNGFWYLEMKGNFFYRLVNIADNHVPTAKTFFDKSGYTLLKRLTYLPLLGFLKGGFFISLGLAVPAMIRLKRKNFRLDKAEDLWAVSGLLLLLSFWFFSTNWRYYSPLPTETRHIVFFIPVFIMTAAGFWPKQAIFGRLNRRVVAFLVMALFLAVPVYAIAKAGKSNFRESEALIQKYLVDDPRQQLVITDGLNAYGYPYFYGFEEVTDRYLWFSEINWDTFDPFETYGSVYIFLNRSFFNEAYNDPKNYDRLIAWIFSKGYRLRSLEKLGEAEVFIMHAR